MIIPEQPPRLKYELVEEDSIKFEDRTLHRIRALITLCSPDGTFSVKPGELGGYIESESNLSQSYGCWVNHNAKVYGNARVFEDAWVCHNAQVFDNAKVSGDATVRDEARVYGSAMVQDNAIISQRARVCGFAWVYNSAEVYEQARVFGNAHVGEGAKIHGEAKVAGDVRIFGEARIYGSAEVFGDAWIQDYAKIYGYISIHGDVRIGGNADIASPHSIFYASYVGTEDGTLTVFKTKNGLVVTRGCFIGTVEEFLKKSREVHNDKVHNEYKMLIEVAKSRIMIGGLTSS